MIPWYCCTDHWQNSCVFRWYTRQHLKIETIRSKHLFNHFNVTLTVREGKAAAGEGGGERAVGGVIVIVG